jgi:hypothetical protein
MARPATQAAEYERFPARLPRELMDALRANAKKTGAPINVELIKAIQRGLKRSSLKKVLV